MSYYDDVMEAAETIRARLARTPKIGVILGSGLGEFATTLADPISIAYDRLPHWPIARVPGHEGRFVAGAVKGRPVAVLAGRCHAYEGYDLKTSTFPVRVLGLLGVTTLVLTNAAGGINASLGEGALMVIDDHLNLMGANPLTGQNDERFGPRFPDMSQVYSPRLCQLADEAGKAIGVALPHGVYAALTGPSFETPAEIRYLRSIGADAVGMSTVPEAIVARHMGIEVLGISCITNMAADVTPRMLAHEDVVATANGASGTLVRLLEEIVDRL